VVSEFRIESLLNAVREADEQNVDTPFSYNGYGKCQSVKSCCVVTMFQIRGLFHYGQKGRI
jgi:hypothetical protein